jgi:hypothetical protein
VSQCADYEPDGKVIVGDQVQIGIWELAEYVWEVGFCVGFEVFECADSGGHGGVRKLVGMLELVSEQEYCDAQSYYTPGDMSCLSGGKTLRVSDGDDMLQLTS